MDFNTPPLTDGHQQGQQFYQEFSHTHHESGLMPIMFTKVDMGVSQNWRPFQIYFWFPHNHFCAIFGSSPIVRHLQIHDMRPLRPPILEAKHVFCFFWLLADWRWNGCIFSAKMKLWHWSVILNTKDSQVFFCELYLKIGGRNPNFNPLKPAFLCLHLCSGHYDACATILGGLGDQSLVRKWVATLIKVDMVTE